MISRLGDFPRLSEGRSLPSGVCCQLTNCEERLAALSWDPETEPRLGERPLAVWQSARRGCRLSFGKL